MRDKNRIKPFCDRLAAAWEQLPDFRFGQLMLNVLGEMAHTGRDPFFPKEEEMMNFIEKTVGRYTGKIPREE